MRSKLLDAVDSPNLRVYAVWLSQRALDARDAIDASLLEDPRVTQYWDGAGLTGTYFAGNDLGGLGFSGFVYDVYYVFGPAAAWAGDLPAPLARAGGPVSYELERLVAAVRAQL